MKFDIEQISQLHQSYLKDSENSEVTNQELKKKYLGKDGELTKLLRQIKDQQAEDRAVFGKETNILKRYIEETVIDRRDGSGSGTVIEKIDITAPFDVNSSASALAAPDQNNGSQHPLTKELENILDIFSSMGFSAVESRQLDDDYNMFEALNFPKGHPARDNWDTFWTEEKLIPPAHTSTMQNRVLQDNNPPIRVVIPGRCFRNEATGPSHEHTLHQIEGVYVDKDISVGDMIGTIKTYLESFFGQKLDVKLQPAFFPFTEPDAEFLVSCPFCQQKGCGICGMTGWMEIMGCGMIHPNVLREGGIDPETYTGFAWGFGLDRLVMVKNGIEDIRWLHSGDLQFLTKFRPNY